MDTNSDTKAPSSGVSWLGRFRSTPKPRAALIGKRALTVGALEVEARDYVRGRMYECGGWREAVSGFRHATGPALVGTKSSLTFRKVAILTVWSIILCGYAVMPVLARRAIMHSPTAPKPGWAAFADIISNLNTFDYVLMGLGIVLVGMPKVLGMLSRTKPSKTHASYVDLATGIRCMPALVGGGPPEDVQRSLTHTLNALRTEMSDLVGDDGNSGLTQVVLLQYCSAAGNHMEVTARTQVDEATRRPVDARLLLANYVGKEGRWFAENDFLSKSNPFKPIRLSVTGKPRVDYRSVLFLPILTATRTPLRVDEHGPSQVVDYCIGVICVHSRKPYRFWRWGDHNNDNGGGSGNVAYERAVPYIALVSKLIERSAYKVPLEARQS